LHLSLAAMGILPGDEVIVPAFTWIATANVVEHVGGKVVFCDIDLETFNLDVQQLASLVTTKTKAILPVHLFGMAADMGPINLFAKQHQLWVVEDAACGFGSRYQGQHVGTLGHTGVFSFHPRKAITTGEGGAAVTNDAALAARMELLRSHGITRNVGSAAQAIFTPRHMHHRHGCLGRDTLDFAKPITIQHDVTHNQYARAGDRFFRKCLHSNSSIRRGL
jgi:dTDP-4-amino-4,6-dideoxygalactose transaminase